MFNQMKQLMEMKSQAERIKRELEASNIEVEKVQGIKVSINGAQKLQSITIDDSLIETKNKERFQSDLLCSINTAIDKSQSLAAQKMKEVTGLNIPGL